MGCGCRGEVSVSSPVKSGAVAVNLTAPKEHKSAICIEKYDELAALDKKLISLHSKFRYSGVGYRYAEAQKIVRSWIKDLNNKCPDADELKEYAEYINKEYAENFNASK